MTPLMKERIAYGRSIRARAASMIEAHGERAELEARIAARELGATEADRLFWEAVADRAARQLTGMAPAAAPRTVPPLAA